MTEAVGVFQLRKPYTITKQRESWSEEEHKKFLEAVQLHGRSWRRIEQHVGTKTTVQIRSHAQKFISKMARETNDNGTSSMKPIEIPPPRPKKKPTHPYPRNLVISSTNEIPVLGKLERSSLPVLSISEHHRSSPSVQSAVGMESIDLFLSNNHENGVLPAKDSVEGDDKHLSLSLALPGLTTEDEPKLELNLISSMEHIRSKEDSLREPNVSTLKLFGRTLMIPDSNRQFAATAGVDMDNRSSQHMLSESNHNAMNLDSGKLAEKAINGGFPTNGTWSVCFTPACYCWPPSYGNEANSAGEAQVIRMPLLPFYANMPFPCAYTQQLMLPRGDLNQANLQNECSGTGSNTGHEGANAVESKQDERSDEKEAGFSVVRKARKLNNGSAESCTKGFEPHRSCDSAAKGKRRNSAEESAGDS